MKDSFIQMLIIKVLCIIYIFGLSRFINFKVLVIGFYGIFTVCFRTVVSWLEEIYSYYGVDAMGSANHLKGGL
jgi:hypothetical protein